MISRARWRRAFSTPTTTVAFPLRRKPPTVLMRVARKPALVRASITGPASSSWTMARTSCISVSSFGSGGVGPARSDVSAIRLAIIRPVAEGEGLGPPVPAHLDHLGHDRQGDLLRPAGADVEADGGVDPVEALLRDPVGGQALEDEQHPPAAADHPDIGGGGADHPAQRLLVVLVAPSDQDQVRPGGNLLTGDGGLEVVDHDLVRVGEALAAGEALPVVDDGGLEAKDLGVTHEGDGDVP